MIRIFLIGFLVLVIAACASHPPAPVINRSPQSTTPQQSTTPSVSSKDDWRPNRYTVKKGDTLYSIGLEFGYDYREIAAANNIYAPYPIKVGQTLNFSSLNKETTASANPTSYENEDGVIITPIDIAPDIEETANISSSTTASGTPAVLSAPKAIREPYSLEAFNRSSSPIEATNTAAATPAESAAATEPTTEIKPAEASTPSKIASSVVDGVTWSWPTQGKVSAPFNAATNKGIDIAGKSGQAITASASGKVIYTGSDLRGYGKLVIIKHSNALLSVYAHNSNITVKEGQIVKAGQKIAEMGDTDASSVKLHFEIRQKGKSVDPALFLPKN